ncbi:MAG: hypothetical protein ACE145_16285 [Terriglobia bacterium]
MPMFDTVAARQEGGPFSPKDASRNTWETRSREFTDPKTMARRVSVIQLLSRPEARIVISGQGEVLVIESSLPKLIYRNNLQSLFNAAPALELLNEFVSDHVDGPIPDLSEMPFSRADYAHNFDVGAFLPDYVDSLSRVPFLKNRARINEYNGVEWWGKNGRRVRAYDKHQEMLEKGRTEVPEARGKLRFEVEIRSKSGFLQRRLKKKRPTLSDVLVPERAYVTLAETLNKMSLDHRFLPLDEARQILDASFSPRTATTLLGLLQRLRSQKVEEVRAILPISTFYRNLRKLREVELYPRAVGDRELPPLRLPKFEEILAASELSS